MSIKSLSIHENETLFGSDNTPGIVAVELKDDSTIEIFRKIKGELVRETDDFNPFLLLEEAYFVLNQQMVQRIIKIIRRRPFFIFHPSESPFMQIFNLLFPDITGHRL